MIFFGTDEVDHDMNLEAALQRISHCALTLNKKKCVFRRRGLIFQGHVFSKHGISPDPAKVEAIEQCTTPKDATGSEKLT